MENRFKLKLSNMFRSSFGSCRTRNLSDVIEKSVFLPENQQDVQTAPPPKQPAALPFPSICRPKCSDSNQPVITIKDVMLPRRKIFEKYPPFVKPFNPDGHTCPPASPISQPLNPFYNHHEKSSKQRKIRDKKKTKAKNSKKNKSNGDFFPFSTSSFDSNTYRGWWSSSDDETDTLFSSKSHSSGPRLRRRSRPNGSSSSSRRRESSDVGLLPLQGRVKDSFAVVKKSSDPYNDFRTSMVEMIFEKQIFSAKDLEQLLQCFLSLNSTHHHRVIIEVFTEIWEALFSNWGS
ncbi:hypothetical protein C1H46_042963 [Malus baccata]|uniref:Transcription repressor n=1 Tax=Malus baccata TaxID=106549 RepID=A0A540KBK2_MALBA|nr:hypothetical protein C1H46_042963 [Malus baccata]